MYVRVDEKEAIEWLPIIEQHPKYYEQYSFLRCIQTVFGFNNLTFFEAIAKSLGIPQIYAANLYGKWGKGNISWFKKEILNVP